jgi:uncharacterized protein (TIGR00255 family)
MVRSMTGFGRGEGVADDRRMTVEIRSVNHRFLEISTRLPRSLATLENRVRERVQGRISRGKVHVGVALDGITAPGATVRVNDEVAERYIQIFRELKARFALRGDPDVGTFITLPEVLAREEEELTEDAGWALLAPPLEAALADFDGMRDREGEALARDLRARIEGIREATERIERRGPEVVARVRERLAERLAQIAADAEYNRQRLEAELTFFADRTDVTEECVRLRSHLAQCLEAFGAPESAGRRLNFLAQELNREANTIGSKCQDLDVTRDVLFVKEEIERIRQQVQNVE